MNRITLCSIVAISFLGGAFGISQRTMSSPESSFDRHMIFSGEVMEIGPSLGFGSGGVRAYQLVKYRVLNVCEGTYQAKEIIADHLILDRTELENLRIGQKVCVGVSKAKQIAPRYDDEKIRKSSEAIETYYIVHDIFIRNCQCSH